MTIFLVDEIQKLAEAKLDYFVQLGPKHRQNMLTLLQGIATLIIMGQIQTEHFNTTRSL